MMIQKSFSQTQDKTIGTLYLVATPIGNLEDMTFRAIRILKEVNWIAAEDTRQTRKLLTHFEISTRMISYHEFNKQASGEDLIRKLQMGQSIALVSDAGLPAISDPGYDLVKLAVEHEIHVVPIPGANAALSALIVSGLETIEFIFIGFLSKNKQNFKQKLEDLKQVPQSILIYESPHRVQKTLQILLEIWGDRQVAVARELTKKFEEIIRGPLSEVVLALNNKQTKGEYCLVIEGYKKTMVDQDSWWGDLTLQEHAEAYIEGGFDRKEATKKVAKDRKVPKREVYNELIQKSVPTPSFINQKSRIGTKEI